MLIPKCQCCYGWHQHAAEGMQSLEEAAVSQISVRKLLYKETSQKNCMKCD